MRDSDSVGDGSLIYRRPHVALLCLLGIGVSLAIWGLLQWKFPFFSVGDEFSIGMGASNEARGALLAEQARVNRLNAAVVFGVAGGLLAGGLGAFAWPCCGLVARVVTTVVGGLIWGAATGWIAPRLHDLMMPTASLPGPAHIGLAQGVIWALFGIGMGLLFAIFERKQSLLAAAALGGAAAGACGGLLYPIIASLALPSQGTTEFIAASNSVRLVWLSLPLVAIAVAVPLICAKKRRSPATALEQ